MDQRLMDQQLDELIEQLKLEERRKNENGERKIRNILQNKETPFTEEEWNILVKLVQELLNTTYAPLLFYDQMNEVCKKILDYHLIVGLFSGRGLWEECLRVFLKRNFNHTPLIICTDGNIGYTKPNPKKGSTQSFFDKPVVPIEAEKAVPKFNRGRSVLFIAAYPPPPPTDDDEEGTDPSWITEMMKGTDCSTALLLIGEGKGGNILTEREWVTIKECCRLVYISKPILPEPLNKEDRIRIYESAETSTKPEVEEIPLSVDIYLKLCHGSKETLDELRKELLKNPDFRE